MSGAVFLSYASQDAEAARRICDALRSGGVEAWFDKEGGLEHGDEWDAKIRRQIKECVLFIPLISANTQARHEGYFRIEWELAAERAMGFAQGVPFILPIVIDDTREPDALVPDRFRKVQWTRLQNGDVPPEVQARFLKLWSHRTGVLSHEAAREMAQTDARVKAVGRFRAGTYALITAAAVALACATGWWLILGRKTAPASIPTAGSGDTDERPVPVSQVSGARQLVARAQALFTGIDSRRDDFALASDLLKQAIDKDGNDAEVWAAYSQLNTRFIVRGFDRSDERREASRAAAQRALRLDPNSFEARLAEAELGGNSPRELSESEQAYRKLLNERPSDRRVFHALARVLLDLHRRDEAIALYDTSARLPGGDPLALYDKALVLWNDGDTAKADMALHAAIDQAPFAGALLLSVWFSMAIHGDLDAARATIERLPSSVLTEDRGCYFAYTLSLYRRDPAAALDYLRALPRDWVNEPSWYAGPKGLLAGNALSLAGRPEAAAVEWRAALKLVEDRLATSSNSTGLRFTRLQLLANLGDGEGASREFSTILQMAGIDPAHDARVPYWVTKSCIALGRRTDAIRLIALGRKQYLEKIYYSAAALRLDPEFDPLRSEPAFVHLIAEAQSQEKSEAAPSAK